MSVTGVCSITVHIFIADMLNDVELKSVAIPASGALFMINGSNPLLDEARRKRLHGKVALLLYGCIESAKLWHQHLKSTLEKLKITPKPEEGCCCLNRVLGDKQCAVIHYADDLLVPVGTRPL